MKIPRKDTDGEEKNTDHTSGSFTLYELPHDKTDKMTVHPSKTQISLGIHRIWSESSHCPQWVAKDPSFLHTNSEDSDQTGRMPRLTESLRGTCAIFVTPALAWAT